MSNLGMVLSHLYKLISGGKGLRSKRVIVLILWFLWALRAWFRENGWLYKKKLTGKHIYLTGAGSGLGRSMAIKFAKMGAMITISDINEEGLKETVSLIQKAGGKLDKVLAITLDVSNREKIRASA